MFRRQYPWRLPEPKESVPQPKDPKEQARRSKVEGLNPTNQNQAEQIPDYLIYGAPLAEGDRHKLSSRVMAWSEPTSEHQPAAWLWQMTDVRSYWQSQARAAAKQAVEAVDERSFLRQQLPDPEAAAVLCQQPFIGLVLLAQMQARQLTGLVDSRDPFGANLWRQAPLPLFFALGQQLGLKWQQHEAANRQPGSRRTGARFHLPEFTRKLTRWQDFAAKASLRTVGDLATLSYPGLRRRYGVFVAQLWQWLFADSPAGTATEVEFPWQSWQPSDLPQVLRHLDYPITAWQGMAPLLAEDLTALSAQMPVSWRVVRLEWDVTFLHLESLRITVAFRHPHGLHSEAPEQVTAVQQAQYGYDALMRTLREREDYLDLPQDLPAVSWQLRLCEYLEVHQRAVPLWADSHHHEQIAQMANRLKVPLRRFQLTEDFLPEASFCHLGDEQAANQQGEPRSDCWLLAASRRPLFIAKEPIPWDDQRTVQGQQFLERMDTKWWLAPPEDWPAARRDYYRSWDRRQLSYWLFQDGAGRWFCHGQYY